MMTKDILQKQLTEHHQAFGQYLNDLSETDFTHSKDEKWSAGQQLEHIFLSVRPLSRLLGNKSEILERFGKAPHPSRTYNDLVSDYHQVLSRGVKAGPRFSPEPTSYDRKGDLVTELNDHIKMITDHLNDYSEDELDTLVIPHPVMGPFTMREMMMFAIYHVQHHLKSVRERRE